MEKTIWKYELDTTDNQEIEIPIGAEMLTIQVQNEIPCLWALVDPKAKKEIRVFDIFGTGHDINFVGIIRRKYIASYQLLRGALIFHVFIRI